MLLRHVFFATIIKKIIYKQNIYKNKNIKRKYRYVLDNVFSSHC